MRNICERFLGVCVRNGYVQVCVGQKTTNTHADNTREKTTDFDGNISYGAWKVIKTYDQ